MFIGVCVCIVCICISSKRVLLLPFRAQRANIVLLASIAVSRNRRFLARVNHPKWGKKTSTHCLGTALTARLWTTRRTATSTTVRTHPRLSHTHSHAHSHSNTHTHTHTHTHTPHTLRRHTLKQRKTTHTHTLFAAHACRGRHRTYSRAFKDHRRARDARTAKWLF